MDTFKKGDRVTISVDGYGDRFPVRMVSGSQSPYFTSTDVFIYESIASLGGISFITRQGVAYVVWTKFLHHATNVCTCDLDVLMNHGCQCGGV